MKIIFITLFLPLISFSSLLAEDRPEVLNKQIANQIYQEFLSPFCPGRALADCPSTKANELKQSIFNDLKSGQTKDDILSNLEREFGSEYNAKPKLSGFAGLAWLVPLIFIILLVIIGTVWAKGNSHK